MDYNDFETRLALKKQFAETKPEQPNSEQADAPLTADKNANLDDFIEMVGKLVVLTMKDQGVQFMADEGQRIKTDPAKKLEHPCITHQVISRVPKDERKPRLRQMINVDGRHGSVYGMRYDVLIQFDILSSEYSESNKVMNIFEEMMFNYTHYFKRNGVVELLFEKHFTDRSYDLFRQNVSVRSLQYRVEIEKLFVQLDSEIEQITVV